MPQEPRPSSPRISYLPIFSGAAFGPRVTLWVCVSESEPPLLTRPPAAGCTRTLLDGPRLDRGLGGGSPATHRILILPRPLVTLRACGAGAALQVGAGAVLVRADDVAGGRLGRRLGAPLHGHLRRLRRSHHSRGRHGHA